MSNQLQRDYGEWTVSFYAGGEYGQAPCIYIFKKVYKLNKDTGELEWTGRCTDWMNHYSPEFQPTLQQIFKDYPEKYRRHLR